jgi:hypothetical protein
MPPVRAQGDGRSKARSDTAGGVETACRRGIDPISGKRRQIERTLRAPDNRKRRRLAETELAKLVAEVEARRVAPRAGLTVAQVFDRWILARSPDWSPGHGEATRRRAEQHVLPYVGDVPVERLRPLDVQSLIDRWRADGMAAVTVRRTFDVLCAALGWAERYQVTPDNPAGRIRKPRPERQLDSISKPITGSDPTRPGIDVTGPTSRPRRDARVDGELGHRTPCARPRPRAGASARGSRPTHRVLPGPPWRSSSRPSGAPRRGGRARGDCGEHSLVRLIFWFDGHAGSVLELVPRLRYGGIPISIAAHITCQGGAPHPACERRPNARPNSSGSPSRRPSERDAKGGGTTQCGARPYRAAPHRGGRRLDGMPPGMAGRRKCPAAEMEVGTVPVSPWRSNALGPSETSGRTT